jgi:hypothetical protein
MTPSQRGVAIGAGCALIVTTALIAYGMAGAPGLPAAAPMAASLAQRLALAVTAWLSPILALALSIGWVANIRGRSDQDIDGAGLTQESAAIRIPRAILANTLEQSSLAIPVYTGLALTLPARMLALPLMLAAAFGLGRIAFAIGYRHGAPARSFGMALTGYPTVAGIGVLIWRLLG